MDNLELWYRSHRGECISDSLGKYYSFKYGVGENAGTYDALDPDTWHGIRNIVRAGKASEYFTPHETQFVSYRGGSAVVWDVIGIDQDTPSDSRFTHSMTLQMHGCDLGKVIFSTAEALYSQEQALPAGTYHFTVVSQPLYTADVGKSFQFTLTHDVPAGGQITVQSVPSASLDGKTVTIYASAVSTDALETAALTEGSGGVSLGNAGDTSTNDMNALLNAINGTNRYADSYIRQWINSDLPSGSVWSPQNKWSRPPSQAESSAGMLYGMDRGFLSAVGAVRKVTAAAEGYDVTNDRFFLLSRREAYTGNETLSVTEGEPYDYYSINSSQPSAGSDQNRVKYKNSEATSWWLRTPRIDQKGAVRYINTSGNCFGLSSKTLCGAAPACCIV